MRPTAVLIAFLCTTTTAIAAPPTESDLHGLWKVTSYVKQVVGSNEITNSMGAHPSGFLELRPDRRALYIVTAEGRKPFSKPPTRYASNCHGCLDSGPIVPSSHAT
jgi:Lipocalin-like domain